MNFLAFAVPEYLTFGDKGFADELAWGAVKSLQIAVLAYALGLVIGLAGSTGKLYGPKWLRKFLAGYTTVVRAVPELVLILLLYFAGTDGLNRLLALLGFEPVTLNGLAAAVIVLGFVQGAYSIEVMRAAIQAVPVGQIEAARAYGMSGWGMMRRIVFPAMLPNALPGLANLWLVVIKDTALIAVVGASPELAAATKTAAGYTKHYLVIYCVTAAIYLAITLISNQGLSRLERYVRRGQARVAH
jgi:polar amino acid transport system permease protein